MASLRTGCQWRAIPESEDLCNGSIAHRWYRRLTDAGAFQLAYHAAVALCVEQGDRKLSSLGVDCTICAPFLGGEATRSCPSDRGKPGAEISIVRDWKTPPLFIQVAAASVRDLKLLLPPFV